MDTQVVALYCICDDILKGLKHYEDKQRPMSDAGQSLARVSLSRLISQCAATFCAVAGKYHSAWPVTV